MEEMLTRRLSHYETYPDLIMMDGGRGQVNIALKVMDAVGVHVPVCGMVKDDHHRTRGIYFNNVDTSGTRFTSCSFSIILFNFTDDIFCTPFLHAAEPFPAFI